VKEALQTQFEKELLKSEKLRSTVLAVIFFVSSVFAALSYLFYEGSDTEELHRGSVFYVFIYLLSLTVFELYCMFYLKFLIKRDNSVVPLFKQYINAAVELSSPVIIILLMAKDYASPVKILHSPVAYTYFLFIILSTLRLNFCLSLFLGVLASAEFLLLSIYLGNKSANLPGSEAFLITSFAKSTILLLSGFGAAYVARQIRKIIMHSIAAAEKENKIVNLFGQQISKEIVEKMLEGNGSLQSKLMQVCVMFIDIRNFTQRVAGKTPAEIVEYQNAFFSIVVKAVIKHQGIVNQFLGDGCMITFGAPVDLPNPSVNAIDAAIEINRELKEQVSLGNIEPTSIGIGVHTGNAVTGNIGTRERQQYSITGMVVILAARIEQLNKEYNSEILVSENVMQEVEDKLLTGSAFIGKIGLKGWHKPIGIYKVA
jgi:adenylate cyclase